MASNHTSVSQLPQPMMFVSPPGAQQPGWVQGPMRQYPQTIHQLIHPIAERDVGFVIGTKGYKIQKINRDTGAFAELRQPNQMVPHLHFIIQGWHPHAVQKAWSLINLAACKAEKLNTGQKVDQPKNVTKAITIDGQNAGLLIGVRGATVREIKQRFHLISMKVGDVDGETKLNLVAENQGQIDSALNYMKSNYAKAFFGNGGDSGMAPPVMTYSEWQSMNTTGAAPASPTYTPTSPTYTPRSPTPPPRTPTSPLIRTPSSPPPIARRRRSVSA